MDTDWEAQWKERNRLQQEAADENARDDKIKIDEAMHHVELIVQHPRALAIERMKALAAEAHTDYDELMSTARNALATGSDYLSSGNYEGGVPDNFWADYALIVDREIDAEHIDFSFSCAC